MKSKVAMLISVATLALSAIAPNAMASGKAQPSARGAVSVSKSAKSASSITVGRTAVPKGASSITMGRTAVSKSASASSKISSHAEPSHALLKGAKNNF